MEKNFTKKVLIGLFIIAAGVVFLFANLGVITHDWAKVIISWQMLLILLGFIGTRRETGWSGLLLVLIGVVFLLPKLSELLGFSYSASTLKLVIWPVVVIIAGLFVIFHTPCAHCKTNVASTGTDNVEGRIDLNFMMSGADKVYPETEFKGGEINAMMGGAKIDLRKATLPEGDTVLKISSCFGGVDLLVPLDWNVVINGSSFCGAFVDQRPGNGAPSDRRLIINASSFFGGGRIQ